MEKEKLEFIDQRRDSVWIRRSTILSVVLIFLILFPAGTLVLYSSDQKVVSREVVMSQQDPQVLINAINVVIDTPGFDNYYLLGIQYYYAGKFFESILAYRMALQYNPQSADIYCNICASYNQLKMWGKARETCEISLQISPSHALAMNNLKWAQNELAD